MPESLLEAAKGYFERQMSVVAVKEKKPLVEWAQWQIQPQTAQEFQSQPWHAADGYAIVCGTKSKTGLFTGAVDFDVKNVSDEARSQGRLILKKLLITQIEETPSGGQHWIYQCHTKPRTDSAFHNECGLELLGEGKLCIMSPSKGYKRLNDNSPAILLDLETEVYEAMLKVGFKPKIGQAPTEAWFGRQDLARKPFTGKNPPCIESLYRSAKEGERNEHAIRLASFLANFRQLQPEKVLGLLRRVNRFNDPPLGDDELHGIIKSAITGGYNYGCNDPVLKRSCKRDDCPIGPANIAKLLNDDETERAEKLLNEAKLLDHVLSYGKRRLIGEDYALLSNFVMFCSGRTRYPISGVISGFSGSGKNQSIRAIKPLIPKEWFFEFTTSTPEAMKYLPEDFDGTLLIYEALGVRGDSGSLSLRAIGEGESIETIYPMRNDLTGKMEMGRAKTNAKNFITTSSDIDINPDLYRRVLKHTMNHSTQLTKRVMAKKLRDAVYPDSMKNILGLQDELPFIEQDFQNALRLVDWSPEVVVFTPPELLGILDLAVKREQEVALRTHVEKIVNFTKVIALLNQKRRLLVEIDKLKYVVAEPNDFLRATEILRSSIMETVSRIEKRQEEALQLFTSADVSLNKNDVAVKLKVSTRTATRLLRTLANSGYLREEPQGKSFQYQLMQKEPNHLDLLKNIRSFSLFHQNNLRNWLNTIWTTGHAKGIPFQFHRNDGIQEKSRSSPCDMPEFNKAVSLGDTSNCPDVHMPSEPDSSLESPKETNELDKIERSRSDKTESKKDPKSNTTPLDKLLRVYWADSGFGWHECEVCGHIKITCCKGETFSRETLWVCEECQSAWEARNRTR